MNKNSTIDTVFKEQLGDMEPGNADTMWQRMEAKLLEQQHKKDRKRYLLFLLLLVPVAAGLIWNAGGKSDAGTAKNTNKTTAATTAVNTSLHNSTNSTPTEENTTNSTVTPSASKKIYTNQPGTRATSSYLPAATTNSLFVKAATTVNISHDAETVELLTPAVMPVEKITAEKKSTIKGVLSKQSIAFNTVTAVNIKTVSAPEKKSRKKIEVSLAAGTDVFGKIQSNGKYAALYLRVPLNKKSNLLIGTGISSHSTSQSYIVSEKQATLNREVDAKLRGLTMFQLPILYEQQLPGKKILARAGITPVYILNAAVTNIPNSFTGVVIPYRTFTIKDINRFNILFTAGLQYNITPKIGIELKGNYGLTELVKNSYLNQSSENNNFKSVQIGFMYRF